MNYIERIKHFIWQASGMIGLRALRRKQTSPLIPDRLAVMSIYIHKLLNSLPFLHFCLYANIKNKGYDQ